MTITNDGATILRLLEVEHPAAKILCELAQLQDEEVGDGTTSVVIIAAELLKNADELVRQKIHPTSVISGYRLACKYVDELSLFLNKLNCDIFFSICIYVPSVTLIFNFLVFLLSACRWFYSQ